MIRYTAIFVCPKTGGEVSNRGRYYNKGVCEVCGHKQSGTIDHSHKEVGHWEYPNRPTFWGLLFRGKPTWVPKNV